MTNLDMLDMSTVPIPDIIETPDFEQQLSQLKATLLALDPSYAPVLELESEPLVKLLQVAAYREAYLIGRINNATRANILASAQGNDLEALASRYNLGRLVIHPGDPDAKPPVPPTLENDEALRRRTQMAFDGLNTAGSLDSYVFHALGADGRVRDAHATSPQPTEITLTLLSHEDDGTVSPDLLKNLYAAFGLTPDGSQPLEISKIRPLGDRLTVQSATIINYQVEAEIIFQQGPSQAPVLVAAQAALDEYIQAQQRLGASITRSGIHRALHQPGVHNVLIAQPATDLATSSQQAPWCAGITLTHSIYGEQYA